MCVSTLAEECVDPSLKQGLGPGAAVTTYYSFKELRSGTGNFDAESKVLDYGELGLLYKAIVSPDEIVAVKRATRESHQSHTDFQKGNQEKTALLQLTLLQSCFTFNEDCRRDSF